MSTVKDINRVGNIDLRKCDNTLEIVKWEKNDLYNKQEDYEVPDKRGLCKSKSSYHAWVHESCFKNPEFCYTLASWDLKEKEPDLRYCGRRPLDLLMGEYEVFEQLVREGYEFIERNDNDSKRYKTKFVLKTNNK